MRVNMNMYHEIEDGNNIAKKMLCILLVALVPLLLIAAVYYINPKSYFLQGVSEYTTFLPAIVSSNNPLFSKVMDVYLKTSPLFSLFFFFSFYKRLKLKSNQSVSKLLVTFICFTVFYVCLIYGFLFTNIELTNSVRTLKAMSTNDITLLLFYITLYAGIYVFGCLYLWFGIGTVKAFKARQRTTSL
ncbi:MULTISPECIES: colicin immunity protein Cui [Serratia]|uniref:colicin immunity protein Cui n=2 Tax=Serratia TaxID=613 RepID=UPI00356B6EF4